MIALAFALTLASASTAAPAAPAAPPPTMKALHLGWKRKPDAFLMTRYFPQAAKDAHVAKAKVALDCTPDAFGTLKCESRSESVTGLGFGDAAVKVLQKGQVESYDSGPPTGRTFRYEVKFGTWAPGED